MLSSIYTKAYFISKYNLNSILIRNPCFYNKIHKTGVLKARIGNAMGTPAGKELTCRKNRYRLFSSIWERREFPEVREKKEYCRMTAAKRKINTICQKRIVRLCLSARQEANIGMIPQKRMYSNNQKAGIRQRLILQKLHMSRLCRRLTGS